MMRIIERPSPNHGPRAADKKVSLLVLHYTELPSAEISLARLCNPAAQVSAHWLVDVDGAVFSVVPEDRRAWHAGESFWEGETDINSISIGVEIQNAGHDGSLPLFPSVQMEAVAQLCAGIMERWAIAPRHVLAHSDVAPARKKDPGEKFDWKFLAEKGVGLWPDSEARGQMSEDRNNIEAAALLEKFGYGLEQGGGLEPVVRAFQRHFYPEGVSGLADAQTLCRLRALVAAL